MLRVSDQRREWVRVSVLCGLVCIYFQGTYRHATVHSTSKMDAGAAHLALNGIEVGSRRQDPLKRVTFCISHLYSLNFDSMGRGVAVAKQSDQGEETGNMLVWSVNSSVWSGEAR